MSSHSTTTSTVLSTRKRKRSSTLQVRFCSQPAHVIYTYSQTDYDRSADLLPSSHHPSITTDDRPRDVSFSKPIIVTVSINFVPTPAHSAPKKRKCARPKLTIDTSDIRGPLYFTGMSTNHQKKSKPLLAGCADGECDADEETMANTKRNSLRLSQPLHE